MNLLKRFTTRLKHYLWLVLALPAALAVIGFLVPVGAMPSSYQAQATVQLGSYEDPIFNETNPVILMLTNAPFYQQQLPQLWAQNEQELLSKVEIRDLNNRLIQLRYRAPSKEEAKNGAQAITDAFLNADRQHYNRREKLIDQTLSQLEKEKAPATDAAAGTRFVYKLQSLKLTMRPAQQLEQVSSSGASVTTLSSKKRAVLGAVIGMTLVLLAAALPEFIRKNNARGAE
ncbi:hypothetical protein [Sporolactobacillus terrae]|uniref:Polysaccharide chain length determinant N-terminal domain-containing protein n=1 Tax=Sporolactobacillus terrae TaxID=269673 RepID=A0ABX5Q529_9BACL|nr:hypothetical protein [Sporolactobacillus terrae]QAA21741.1 hypothetical protein C0674_03385 [Sporolactobacillus terrae]QAA24713.1 hypothetical protein C0679_03365 [Sporolactobacillus terrae]UAK16544.1 hypothetical protein K7399_00750 [Sporolactobacillus terrae]